MKHVFLYLSALCLISNMSPTLALIPKDAAPKLEKSICFGCQLTESQKIELQDLIKNYNRALNAYCAWIWIVQRQNFVHRPSKEALHQSRKHKENIANALNSLIIFYQSAGIPEQEVAQLKSTLDQGENQLICDLATLSLSAER
ncbi:TPA: hypothetical protein DCW54_02685 [Candidatus Dependentiae bacterium]|nr:hypothetical protein [Candidatus Dependentiae bacterium]